MYNRGNILSKIICENTLMPKIELFNVNTYKTGDTYSNHIHKNKIEIMYVFQGFIYMGVNNHYIKIKKNDCLIISPNTVHNLILKKNEKCRAACIVFDPGEVSKYFSMMDLQNNLPFLYELIFNKTGFFRIVDNNNIKNIVERMYHQKNIENEYAAELMKLYFCELYIHLSILFNENIVKFECTNNKYIGKALEFIANNYVNDISVEDVAEFVGISQRHLARVFEQQLCMTIHEYIIFLRIEKAKKLLLETNQKITTIALCIGFNTPQYFATTFKKVEKTSPKNYRKLIENREANYA